MKTVNSGIIRRMDDLGRVVIPKEMRKIAGIKEGDALEIGVANGCIIFEKYTGEIDKETGNPIPPKQETPSPKKITLYVDTYEQKAYKTLEELIPIMADNEDITTFEEYLCNCYTASSLAQEVEEIYKGDWVKANQELRKDYEDCVFGEAQDLLNNIRINDYITIEVEL